MLSGANQVPSGSVETKKVSVGCETFGPDEPPRNVAKFVVNPQPQHEALRRENLGRCNICTTLLVYISKLESSSPAFALILFGETSRPQPLTDFGALCVKKRRRTK